MSEGEDHDFLLTCLGNENLSDADLQQAREIIRRCGALNAIEEMAKDCIKKAKESLFQLPENKYRDLLDQMADFLIQRQY